MSCCMVLESEEKHVEAALYDYFERNSEDEHRIVASDSFNSYWYTLPEANIDRENGPSQKEFHLPTIDFQWLC